MKIAFLASIRGSKQFGDYYSTIISFLTNKGYTVNHVLSVTENILASWSQEKRAQFFNNFYKELSKADLVVAECSFPSINVGYEISRAIQQGKEVIILKSEQTELSITHLDPIYLNKNVYIYEYTKHTLKRMLEEALRFTPSEQYKKFNILLPPQMLAKLNLISKKRRIPKSVYIRQLIEKGITLEKEE